MDITKRSFSAWYETTKIVYRDVIGGETGLIKQRYMRLYHGGSEEKEEFRLRFPGGGSVRVTSSLLSRDTPLVGTELIRSMFSVVCHFKEVRRGHQLYPMRNVRLLRSTNGLYWLLPPYYRAREDGTPLAQDAKELTTDRLCYSAPQSERPLRFTNPRETEIFWNVYKNLNLEKTTVINGIKRKEYKGGV